MPEITFLPANITVESSSGASLLEAARSAGVYIETPCGGKGTCQKCNVKIITDPEQTIKNALICQTKVPNHPITVELPKAADVKVQFELFEDPSRYLSGSKEHAAITSGTMFLKKINLTVSPPALLDGLSDSDRFIKALKNKIKCETAQIPLNILSALPEKLRENEGEIQIFYYEENSIVKIVSISVNSSLPSYGIAIDIGTTTVALLLTDLENGKVLSSHNAYNSQIECGLDVISRINYAKKNLLELRTRIIKTINELLLTACGDIKIDPNQILCVSIAGNTTMIHLFLGIAPEYIRLSPYTPAVFKPQIYNAGDVNILICENAPILIAPAVGSYVGGDITAGILCTSLALNPRSSSNELILFIDIGTNGEIVLGNNDFILACACSAGPAFEGGGIKHGMRASEGAIERVSIDENGNPQISVINGVTPTGICGSGIISAAAELFRKGIIDSAGKFSQKNGEYKLSENILINETDIDNFIRAKGAIFSACQTMLDNVGFSFNDIERVYVAGGFGRYLDLEDARTVGLLPRLPNEKFTFLGNSSAIGAYLAMVSEERRSMLFNLAEKITYMDLSSELKYMDHYTGALFLPHTDKKLFD